MTLEGFEPLTSVLQTYALPAATESSDCLPALWQLRHAVTYRRTTGLDNCFRVLPILQVPDVFLLSPHPLCPTMVMNSPFFTCRLMSCSTSIGCLFTRNCLFRCVTLIMSSLAVSIPAPPCLNILWSITMSRWCWLHYICVCMPIAKAIREIVCTISILSPCIHIKFICFKFYVKFTE